MKVRRMLAIAVIVVLVGAVSAILVHKQATSDAKGLQVVAAENFWGDIAQQLGGSHVHVTSIITNPNADPHLYESDAQDAADVARADVVIVNGLGYDDFMGKLLGNSDNNGRQVITAQTVYGAPEGANQHLWYDIPRVETMASRITAAYIAKDPAHKSDYQHDLTAFDQSLQPLLQTIDRIRRQYGGTPVAYTEPVPGYLLNDAGLSVKTPEGFAKSIEDGVDPSPADTAAMDALMTNKSVKVLLYNAQATSPVTEHVKGLAEQAGIPVIGVTETLPPDQKSYQSWQASQMQQLEAALAQAT